MRGHIQSGKIRFSTLIIVVILFYVGYAAVKIASAYVMKGQIKTASINNIGEVRGPELTVAKCEEIILGVLQDNGVISSEEESTDDESKSNNATTDKTAEEGAQTGYEEPQITVKINNARSNVHFTITYQYASNLVLFKYKKVYFVEGDVQNYN